MKLENQVVCKESSEKIAKLGVKQESLWWWYNDEYQKISHLGRNKVYGKRWKKQFDSGWVLIYTKKELLGIRNWESTISVVPFKERHYSAFTVAELGEMLPKEILSNKEIFSLRCSFNNRLFHLCYMGSNPDEPLSFINADTEANARAKMLIWLIENKKMESK